MSAAARRGGATPHPHVAAFSSHTPSYAPGDLNFDPFSPMPPTSSRTMYGDLGVQPMEGFARYIDDLKQLLRVEQWCGTATHYCWPASRQHTAILLRRPWSRRRSAKGLLALECSNPSHLCLSLCLWFRTRYSFRHPSTWDAVARTTEYHCRMVVDRPTDCTAASRTPAPQALPP